MRRPFLTVVVALAVVPAAVGPVAAQDTSHPAGIYAGTCPVPGNLVVSLWDASPSFLVDGESEAGEPVGSQVGFPVEASVTIVELALADLVATEHAILVHRSQAELDDYVVCGDIGGVMQGADELAVALSPVGLSAWSGIAVFDDEADGTTTVSLYVFEGPGIDTGADEVPLEPFPSPTARSQDDRPEQPRGRAEPSPRETREGGQGDGDDDDEGDDDDDEGDDDDDD